MIASVVCSEAQPIPEQNSICLKCFLYLTEPLAPTFQIWGVDLSNLTAKILLDSLPKDISNKCWADIECLHKFRPWNRFWRLDLTVVQAVAVDSSYEEATPDALALLHISKSGGDDIAGRVTEGEEQLVRLNKTQLLMSKLDPLHSLSCKHSTWSCSAQPFITCNTCSQETQQK